MKTGQQILDDVQTGAARGTGALAVGAAAVGLWKAAQAGWRRFSAWRVKRAAEKAAEAPAVEAGKGKGGKAAPQAA